MSATIDIGLDSPAELTARFELGTDARADEIVSSIAAAVSVARFQVAIDRAGTFVQELEQEVSSRLTLRIDPAPSPEWLAQHASSFGLNQPGVIDFLERQTNRWGTDFPARIRADVAEALFLGEDSVTEGRLALLARSPRYWRVSSIDYRNPLVMVFVIGTPVALTSLHWILNIVNKVQQTALNSAALNNARLEKTKLEKEIEKSQLDMIKTAAETDKVRLESQLLMESRRPEELLAELTRLKADVEQLEAEAVRQGATQPTQAPPSSDSADRQRDAVLARIVVDDDSSTPSEAFAAIAQATVEFSFKTRLRRNSPATLQQADSLAALPPLTGIDVTSSDT